MLPAEGGEENPEGDDIVPPNCEALDIPALYEFLLFSVAILGDGLAGRLATRWSLAICDNLVHGLIGFWSWAAVTGFSTTSSHALWWCLLSMVIAMAVDVDHFLAAHSLNLRDALSLPTRPPFHITTLVFMITLTCYGLFVVFRLDWIRKFSVVFLVACLSHHIRDGSRRGLWLWPFGSTPPLPYWLYIVLILALPLMVRWWL